MITLCYPVAKKYETILEKSLVRHINLCLTPIKKIFLILDSTIDLLLIDKLRKLISNIEIEFITDDQAIEILNFKSVEYQKVIKDKHYFQQMLKLHIDILSNEDKVVIADADGLILTPVNYIENNKNVIFYAENSSGYWGLAEQFFNFKVDQKYDFLTEKMLFDSTVLKELRRLYKDNFLLFTESRHKRYDISVDEYNFFKGASYPEYDLGWQSFPTWVQEELKDFIPDELTPTAYSHKFSEYQIYGIFAQHFFSNDIILKPTKVQSGPFDKSCDKFDVFINRPFEGGTIDAFDYIYQKYDK